MSRVLKTVAIVAGAAALVATGVGAFAVAGSAIGIAAGKVAAIATLVSGVASIGASITQPATSAKAALTTVSETVGYDPSKWPLDRGRCLSLERQRPLDAAPAS